MLKRLRRKLKPKNKTELFLFDPLRRSLDDWVETYNNPFINDIKYYMQHEVLPKLISMVEEMKPLDVEVDYRFRWHDEWFIKTSSVMTIMKSRLYNGIPEEMIGGKAYFDLIVNGEEVSGYILEIEWDEAGLQTNLSSAMLARFSMGDKWESPKKWKTDGPGKYRVGSAVEAEVVDPVDHELKNEVLLGLKSMGVIKANVDMAKVDEICSRDWGTLRRDEALGQALSAYFYQGK